jgi:hypothetical protein
MTWWQRAAGAALVSAIVAVSGCRAPKEPIVVDEGMIIVANHTSREWRNVKVTVNDYFNGGAPVLSAGGALNAPLSQFQTGLGQRFDRGRQSVYKVEVTATEPDGTPVTLKWGGDKK